MSEEEAIRNLEIYIKVTEKQIESGELFLYVETEKNHIDSIKKLLDLYNKEKQLRKELIMQDKTMIDKFKDMIKAEMQEIEDMDWDEACFLPLERLLKDVEELEDNV